MNSYLMIKEKIDAEFVSAYKYRVDIKDNSEFFSKRNFSTIIEYYIPSSKICFNEHAIFSADHPRNIPKNKSFTNRSEPLTLVNLSKELVQIIEIAVENPNFLKNVMTYLKTNAEYQLLFCVKRQKPDKNNFWENYRNKGNNVIKKAIIKYILNDALPHDMPLSSLMEINKNLDIIERKSLEDCIKDQLAVKNDKLITMREKAIQDIKKDYRDSDIIGCGLLGATTGAILGIDPAYSPAVSLACIGLGFFTCAAVKYTEGENKIANENKLWDEREGRVKIIEDEFAKYIPDLS